MKIVAKPRPGICAIAAIALSCSAALADDTKPPAANAPLPGVDPARTVPAYRQPAPEPEPNDPAASGPDTHDGYTRIGNWDVRVSGSVSYEMGVGTGSGHR